MNGRDKVKNAEKKGEKKVEEKKVKSWREKGEE